MSSLHHLLSGCLGLFLFSFVVEAGKPAVCYQGQSYWCQNITTAATCNAVKHCIYSVWEKEVPIEADTSSVCQTCMDMVKMARDQLQSNETEEELKEVLEGICQIIPEKHLKNDCNKMMDDFGSYLVDTLSSQMDPSVVCSVAGLCYNDKYKNVKVVKQLNCNNCQGLMTIVEGDIEGASMTELHAVLQKMCKALGTFSDVCQALLAEHMESVDALIRNNVRAQPVCDLAGVCAEKYHSHKVNDKDVQVFGAVDDDLTCEFCQQLVKHLHDVLIANTTEDEMKLILQGFCRMSRFKDECGVYIDKYYVAVYDFLVNELNGKILCEQVKLCNAAALLENEPVVVSEHTPVESTPAQLPVERMKFLFQPQGLVNTNDQVKSSGLCSFCEYLLHFVQQEITLPSSEREITVVVEHACSKLPATVKGQCDSFIDTYMAQFIAILANNIDPSQVCPSIGLCPGQLVAVEYKDKPTCSLCLLAVEGALKKIQNKSENVIRDVLDDLCMRDEFPTSVLLECVKFVTDFKEPVTDMIIADFTSQEACVYIDLCAPPQNAIVPPQMHEQSVFIHPGDIATNEIHEQDVASNPVCALCEFIMSKLMKMVADKKTEEDFKQALLKVCVLMPKTVTQECDKFINDNFNVIMDLLLEEVSPALVCREIDVCFPFLSQKVETKQIAQVGGTHLCLACKTIVAKIDEMLGDSKTKDEIKALLEKECDLVPASYAKECKQVVIQYADLVLDLLSKDVPPEEVCDELKLCVKTGIQMVENTVKKCVFCEVFMDFLKVILTNEEVDEGLNEKMDKACQQFPNKDVVFCRSIVDQLGPQIEQILRTVPVGPLVCRRIHMCQEDRTTAELHLIGVDLGPDCFSGPEYWCATSAQAVECDKVEYCQKNVWMTDKPGKRKLKGSDVM